MTRVIAAVLIGLALLGAWGFMKYAQKYEQNGGEVVPEQPVRVVRPEELSGLPGELQSSLDIACRQGGNALRQWLKAHGNKLQDPRKAWIELDYCRMISRDDPNEAKRVFAAVKKRTPTSSPVWPRILELSGALE